MGPFLFKPLHTSFRRIKVLSRGKGMESLRSPFLWGVTRKYVPLSYYLLMSHHLFLIEMGKSNQMQLKSQQGAGDGWAVKNICCSSSRWPRVQILAPTWQLTTIYNSNVRESDAFWPLCVLYACVAQIYKQNTQRHTMKKNKSGIFKVKNDQQKKVPLAKEIL